MEGGGSETLRNSAKRIRELETALASTSRRNRELEDQQEKFLAHMENMGMSISFHEGGENKEDKGDNKRIELGDELTENNAVPFFKAMFERSSWLSGLLIFQSFSSLILASNQHVLEKHHTVVYFLTALVGAGGNAGNQASVRVIRGLALGTLTQHNVRPFLTREAGMAVLLALTVGFIGLIRAVLSPCTGPEIVTVVISLMSIVFISVIVGAVLPLILHAIKVDPAHAATSVQVIMDISGCFLTMFFTRLLLESETGQYIVGFLVRTE